MGDFKLRTTILELIIKEQGLRNYIKIQKPKLKLKQPIFIRHTSLFLFFFKSLFYLQLITAGPVLKFIGDVCIDVSEDFVIFQPMPVKGTWGRSIILTPLTFTPFMLSVCVSNHWKSRNNKRKHNYKTKPKRNTNTKFFKQKFNQLKHLINWNNNRKRKKSCTAASTTNKNMFHFEFIYFKCF